MTTSSTNEGWEQIVLHPDLTSSKTGTFYFAYGSNLSPTQMGIRLQADANSSIPVAIARLDAYAWIICQRGYANVVALPPNNTAVDENTVWGVLYNLTSADEARLDLYEGHSNESNPNPEINPDVRKQVEVPYLQGPWAYNKHYLPVTVTKWLQDPNEYGVKVSKENPRDTTFLEQQTTIRTLVYVDELRTQPGKINQEYIGRMNRAIREGITLGLPQRWVESVMRKFIPAGVEVAHERYVGTDKGYVESESKETAEEVKKRVLKEMG